MSKYKVKIKIIFVVPLQYSIDWYSCCCSVTKLCLILCNPMDSSMPGFPVLQYLTEFAQIHVHWVTDAIQPSHPLPPPLLLPSIFPSIRVFPSKLSPNWHVRSLTSSYLSPAPQANNLQAGDIWIHRFSLQYSGLENSLDWIVCEVAELDMTEQLLLSLSRCLLGANGNNPFNALSKNEKKINVFCFVFSINNWESLLQ